MQSFRNPVERCMSLLNLGLQAVGMMRSPMQEEEFEKAMKSCDTMSDLREAAKEHPALEEALKQSLKQPMELLVDVFTRLSLKGEKVEMGQPATEDEMEQLWDEVQKIDSTLQQSDTTQT